MLDAKLDRLLSLVTQLLGQPKPRAGGDDELVGSAYVAKLFGCKVSSVRDGKAGTRGIRWVSRRPLKCTRKEAHAAVTRLEEQKTRKQKARRSLIRRR